MIMVVVHEVAIVAAAVVVVAERIASIVVNQVIGRGIVLLVAVVGVGSFLVVEIDTVDVIAMGVGLDIVDVTMEVVIMVGIEVMTGTTVVITAVGIEAMTDMMTATAEKAAGMETAMEAGTATVAVDQQGMKGDTKTELGHTIDRVEDGLSMKAVIDIWQRQGHFLKGSFLESV